MASLKEVKGRIASVNNTRKITSAMKMVASAKLHKAQGTIEHILPYSDRLHRMLTDFLAGTEKVESPFAVQREVERVAVVVFSSNTSLCGAFNTNVIRRVGEVLAEYAPLGRARWPRRCRSRAGRWRATSPRWPTSRTITMRRSWQPA
jgi:F-type H+-transporting ATPase subunit gamma